MTKQLNKTVKPVRRVVYRVGEKIQNERLGRCRIVRVHPFGTVDVEAANGRWYRMSGLPVYQLD